MYRIILFALFLFPVNFFAQELVTDRPDQTESAVTVPLGSLQIETGFLYENSKEGNLTFDNYSIAGTLFRYGLFEKIELRIGTTYIINKAGGYSETGFGDFLLGTKINFLTEDSAPFDFGLMLHTSVPVGNKSFNPDKFEPELIAAFSKSLSDLFSFSANAGGFHDSSVDDIIYLYTAALGFGFTDKFGGYIEVFGNFSNALYPIHYYDGGFTFLLNDNVQLDIFAGSSFTGNINYWFIGTGISFRIDNLH